MTRKQRPTVLALAACLMWLSATAAMVAPGKGEVPPAHVGKSLDGKPVLVTDHPGRAVVVSYWATWCKYCLEELPKLDAVQRLIGKQHLQVIAVNTEDRALFRKVVKSLAGIELQLAYDPDKQGQKAYGVSGLPHLVIIGRDGRIVEVHRGYSEGALKGIIESINRATGAVQ